MSMGSLGTVAASIPLLEVVCGRCPRWSMLSTARLLAEHGDVTLPVLCHILSRDCPNRDGSLYSTCDVWYPGLAETLR